MPRPNRGWEVSGCNVRSVPPAQAQRKTFMLSRIMDLGLTGRGSTLLLGRKELFAHVDERVNGLLVSVERLCLVALLRVLCTCRVGYKQQRRRRNSGRWNHDAAEGYVDTQLGLGSFRQRMPQERWSRRLGHSRSRRRSVCARLRYAVQCTHVRGTLCAGI